jgi:hypothetical protein
MNKYKVPCAWEMYGYIEVEAETMEDAIRQATLDAPLPNGNYIEGSFAVDYPAIEEVHEWQR